MLVSADSIALHQAMGTFVTQRRAHRFLARNKIEIDEPIPIDNVVELEAYLDKHNLGNVMLRDILGMGEPPKPTACASAKHILENTPISQAALDRAKLVSYEAGVKYPAAGVRLLRHLIDEFNDIKDGSLLNQLKQTIVSGAKNVEVGMALSEYVSDVISEIRIKDRIACDIVRIVGLLDQTIARSEALHRVASSNISAAERDALRKAMGSSETLTADERGLMAGFFKCASDEVDATITEYVDQAFVTRFVEEQMTDNGVRTA